MRTQKTSRPQSRRTVVENLEQRRLLAWGMWPARVDLDDAVSNYSSFRGQEQVVVVIDSGINRNAPDFVDRIWQNPGETGTDTQGRNKATNGVDDDQDQYIDNLNGWNYINENNDVSDVEGHGTVVSGIIVGKEYTWNTGNGADGADYRGVASQAKVISMKLYGANTLLDDPTGADFERALQWVKWAVDNKPQYNIRAINISGHIPDASAQTRVADELAYLKSHGIFIAAASGNGPGTGTIYPASSPSAYAVGGVTETDLITTGEKGTTYGPNDSYLDIMAPGQEQPGVELGTGGRHFVQAIPATSFATPWVTGLALLIKQINPNFTPDEIIDIMQDSTDVSVSIPGPNGGWTEKRIDIDNALARAIALTPTPPSSLTGGDIGSPVPAGSTTPFGADGFDVVAGGNDVWNAADAFHFARTQVTGDFDVKAKVESFTAGSDPWAKAGIMARTALTHTSANVFMLATPGANGYRFQVRGANSGTTTAVAGAQAVSYPNTWVRLRRQGNTFTGYSSSNGTTWTQVSSQTVTLPSAVYLGLAATSHNTSAATTVKFRTWGDTTPTNVVPFDFSQGADVGSPATGGSTNRLSDTSYNVAGAGNDIWGGGDQFYYARQQITGNFDARVKVNSFSGTPDPWAKAGLMARKTLSGNSENFAMLATPGANGYRFQKRTTVGGTTTADAGAATANRWVRLTRVGDTFTGYSSNDGVNWTTVGSQTLAMGSTIYLGLAVTSHNAGALTTVNFSDLSG